MHFDAATADELAESFEAAVSRALALCADAEDGGDVSLYAAGLARLSEVLRRAQEQYARADPSALTPEEISELGAFGYGLVEGLRSNLPPAGAEASAAELEQLQIPLALWIVRHGGGWSEWEALINALAAVANRLREPLELRRLSAVMAELVDAAPADLRSEFERLEPSGPWRILHLNWAIVAARSMDPEAMEPAFEALLACLPEDAGPFFAEGAHRLVQMGAPQEVLDCLHRYQRRAPQATAH